MGEQQEFLERLLATAKPHVRGQSLVRRGNQREPLLQVEPPAYATSTTLLARLVGDIAMERLDGSTRHLQAFRVLYSDEEKVMIWIPEGRYDREDRQLLPVRWPSSRRLLVNLIEVFQPRGIRVMPGDVMEIPVRAVDMPQLGPVLLVMVREQVIRSRRKRRGAEMPLAPAPGATEEMPLSAPAREAAAGQPS